MRRVILSARTAFNGSSAKFSTSKALNGADHYRLVVVGGGTAGTAVSNKFGSKLGKSKVAVLEPAETHYYQPGWTLYGGGVPMTGAPFKPHKETLTGATHIPDAVAAFDPDSNSLTTKSGKELKYDFLVVSTGILPDYDKIIGLRQALETPGVCSNYSPVYVQKTFPCIRDLQDGNALFTFPAGVVKCAGAPQKIAYLAEAYFKKAGKRDRIRVIYNTSMPSLYSHPHYSGRLVEMCKERDIEVNLLHNLIEVKPDTREAVFEILKDGKRVDTKTWQYSLLHAAPPHFPVDAVKKCSELTNEMGFVTVDKYTLQHVKFPNIFALGDCSDIPTPKTAAAVASQTGIVRKNLTSAMKNKPLEAKYNGYTSCPIVVGNKLGICAEFDYDFTRIETLPIDQSEQRRIFYHLKKDILPVMYWEGLLKGRWEGPNKLRKLLRFGFG